MAKVDKVVTYLGDLTCRTLKTLIELFLVLEPFDLSIQKMFESVPSRTFNSASMILSGIKDMVAIRIPLLDFYELPIFGTTGATTGTVKGYKLHIVEGIKAEVKLTHPSLLVGEKRSVIVYTYTKTSPTSYAWVPNRSNVNLFITSTFPFSGELNYKIEEAMRILGCSNVVNKIKDFRFGMEEVINEEVKSIGGEDVFDVKIRFDDIIHEAYRINVESGIATYNKESDFCVTLSCLSLPVDFLTIYARCGFPGAKCVILHEPHELTLTVRDVVDIFNSIISSIIYTNAFCIKLSDLMF